MTAPRPPRRALLLVLTLGTLIPLAYLRMPEPAAEGQGPAVSQVPAANRDWLMLGGSPERNAVNLGAKKLPDRWSVMPPRNIKWVAKLGSQSYGSPVIANGKVFVGTNNDGLRNPRDAAKSRPFDKRPYGQDKGILLCLREDDGSLLWQAVHDKLPSGRVNDFPLQGVASTPCVEDNRVYYVSNRCELVCADVEGLANGNQGIQDEQYQEPTDADFLWKLDMMKELDVFPHNLAASSPLIVGELVFVITGNGHDESHEHIPKPNAPSFLAVNKHTGKVVWQDNSPGKNILHAQWSSPTYAEIKGQPQVIFPGGDGWLRTFEPTTGKLLWKFDCNPKAAKYILGGRGTRNEFIAPAVVHDQKVYVTVGQDPEHSDGVGHLWCIDPSKASATNVDLTPVNDNFDPQAPENRNSGLVWHFGGFKAKNEMVFRRSLSCCVVARNLCFVADLSGFVYCLDAKTGALHWKYDSLVAIWAAPVWIDNKIYLGTDEGDLYVLGAMDVCHVHAKIEFPADILGPVAAANGVLYVKTRSELYAIAEMPKKK